MNYLKENPIGIDYEIKRLQIYLYNNISNKFGLDDFDAYGRVYKNKKDRFIIPEYYLSNRDYKEVLLDDRRSGIMFFSPSSNFTDYGGLVERYCDIMFTFNLDRLYGNENRNDEEIRTYVLTLLNNYIETLGDKEVETDLMAVYKDYNGVASYFYDMQEFHHFKIKIKLRFNNKTC